MDAVATRALAEAGRWPRPSDVPEVADKARRLFSLGRERSEPAALNSAITATSRVCHSFLGRAGGRPGPEVAQLAEALGFAAIAEAVRANKGSLMLCGNAVALLTALTTSSPERKQRAAASGVAEAAVAVLGAHQQRPTVVAGALTVLSNLSQASRESDLCVLAAGAVQAAAAALRAHPEHPGVQQQGCAVLSKLMGGPARAQAASAIDVSGAVRLVAAAMKRSPDNEDLVSNGLIFLSSVVLPGTVGATSVLLLSDLLCSFAVKR